jgi:hypothetical protein
MFFRFFLFVFSVLILTPAASARTGIVVRLVTGGEAIEAPVEAILVNDEDKEYKLTLVDNGEPPDVSAGDYDFSGSSIIEGENFAVFVSTNGNKEEVGEVSWPADVTARDLIITRYEGIVTLETGAGDNQQPPGEPSNPGVAGSAPEGDVAPGGAIGGPSTPGEATSPARSPNVSFPEPNSGVNAQDDATLYVIGGILLLILAAVAFFWFREPSTASPSGDARPRSSTINARVHRMPEPGLLGDGSPSLSDGTSFWVVSETDAADFTQILLASMAQHHQVLVVSSTTDELPLVHGGPVYRMKSPRPTHVADAVNALAHSSGQPVAILIHAAEMDSSLLNDYADLLPGNVGAAVVVHNSPGGLELTVDVSRTSSGWHLNVGAKNIHLQAAEWGLSVTEIAPDAGAATEPA